MRTSLLGALLGIWIALPQPAAAEGHGIDGQVLALPGLRITIGHVWHGDHRERQVRPPRRHPTWSHRPPAWRAPRPEMHHRPHRGDQVRRHHTTRRHEVERGGHRDGHVGDHVRPRAIGRPTVRHGPRRVFRHGAPAERREIEAVRRAPGRPRDQH